MREAKLRRERRATELELKNSREQLRALTAHLQSIREEDRKLIAREIHDELGQSLTGFKMDLAWIRHRLQPDAGEIARQPLLDRIGEMGSLLDGAADLIRKLCTELRPGILDDLGLLPAVEWQAREFQKRTGIKCALKVGVTKLDLDADCSTALFRIFQEILTNVARHAGATRVQAKLLQTGKLIMLEVADNGKGIEPDEVSGKKSLGLLGMRERALLFGGQVSISGSKGRGTTVKVTIPLPQPPATSKTRKSSRDRGAIETREGT